MSDPALVYEKHEGIAYLTFNRPAVRNAMSPEVMCRLADAWHDYAADDSLRVAIITGAGDRAFSAGADLGTFIPLLTGARVMPKAQELARKIAANDPVAVRKIKETVLRSLSVSLAEGFQIENENARLVLATEDAKEGPRAFMEKRQPRYVGR